MYQYYTGLVTKHYKIYKLKTFLVLIIAKQRVAGSSPVFLKKFGN